MNNFYKQSSLAIALLFTHHFFGEISAPQKQTLPVSLDVQINRIEIALTGGFTQAFESKNLILYPPTEESFNKWQQAVAATQQLFAKKSHDLAIFVDPLIDVNRILNQTFIALRRYYRSLGEEDRASSSIKDIIDSAELIRLIEPLEEALIALTKIKNRFELYRNPSHFQRIKNLFRKSHQTRKHPSDVLFYPLINRMIMSIEIIIDRILTKDAKKIDADLSLLL